VAWRATDGEAYAMTEHFFRRRQTDPAQLAKIVEKLGMVVAISEIRIASADGWQDMSPHHAR